MAGGARTGRESGQAAVEWVALVALVAVAAAGLGGRAGGLGLATAILSRIECALGLGEPCGGDSALDAAYGAEIGAALRAHAPEIRYEHGMTALPVDFRSCRDAGCGNGPRDGGVWASDTGEPAVAFVHVVDCRRGAAPGSRHECSGERAGRLYLQYWLYYEDSTTAPALPGDVGRHEDDWEAYEVRIGPGGVEARASSHHGWSYEGGPGNWPSDTGVSDRPAWGPATGRLYVSGGSHAGHAFEPWDRLRESPGARARRRAFGAPPHRTRWTPADRLLLIPLESLGRDALRSGFAVTPPWRKDSWRDPEA